MCDVVPARLMPLLTPGKVLVTKGHVFEAQTMQGGGVSSQGTKAGESVLSNHRFSAFP